MAEQSLTIKQERLVHVLASGKADSMTHAAELAGTSTKTVQRLSKNVHALARIEQLKQRKLDKARGAAALADKILSKGEEYLADLSSREKLAFALEAKKLSAQLPEERADKAAQVESFHRHCQRVWDVATRWERRRWLRNSAELTPALQDQLPDITIESSEVLCNQSDNELTYSPLSDHTSQDESA